MLQNLLLWSGYIANWGLVLQIAQVPSVNADCYAFNKVLASESNIYKGPDLVSCGNNTNTCCLFDEKCGSNLLCANAAGTSTRQYCADKDWDKCSQMCTDVFPRSGTLLTDCGNNIFCCGTGNTKCCDEKKGFYVNPLNGKLTPAASADGGSFASPTYWKVDTSAVLASSASASRASQSTSTFASTTSLSSSGSATTTGSIATTTATGLPVNTPDPQPSRGLSAGAGAGIGVGCVAALAGIGALIWFFLRKRKQEKNKLHSPSPPYYDTGYASNKPGTTYAYNPPAPAPAPVQELEGTNARYEMR